MKSQDVLLVGYELQENLGLRSISAVLQSKGYRVNLLPFSPDNPLSVIKAAQKIKPVLVGFSIIFQYTLSEFGSLMDRLREEGINSHFTCGGHFPSLCPDETLAELTALDSVIRFEGEETISELLQYIDKPKAWSSIKGLAFKKNSKTILTSSRPLTDLDELPWPVRNKNPPRNGWDMGIAPLLASRGCLYNCSFCSIQNFYSGVPGPKRRSRSPHNVVAEMSSLYQKNGVQIFLFQDDDFAFRSRQQREWIRRFLKELDQAGISDKIGWKISCRVDDVEKNLVNECREHGLLAVYLGVESGNEQGLKTLNKQLTVKQNLDSLKLLASMSIYFDLGFMLFDPDSSFTSVKENLFFLKEVAKLHGPPISFVKMLPLAGTSIQKRLSDEGRLKGDVIRPDYELNDPRLELFALFIILNFSSRNSGTGGLVELLRQANFDTTIASRMVHHPKAALYRESVERLTEVSNCSALQTIENVLEIVENCNGVSDIYEKWPLMTQIAQKQKGLDESLTRELIETTSMYNPELSESLRMTFESST